jgi:predicted anti-sigma-YlaC factor YlaD
MKDDMRPGSRGGSRSGPRRIACATAREELSAILDGEEPTCASEDLEAHLASCAECSRWRESAHLVTRRIRLTVAPAADESGDRTDQILAAVLADRPVRDRRRRARTARIGVAASALAHSVVIVPALAGRAGHGIPMQTSRELGVFNVTIAFALLVAAARPNRARAIAPVVGMAAGLLTLVDFIDVCLGVTTARTEMPHLITVVGAVLLAVLGRNVEREGTNGPPTDRPSPGARMLRRILRRLPVPSGVAVFALPEPRNGQWPPARGPVPARSRVSGLDDDPSGRPGAEGDDRRAA